MRTLSLLTLAVVALLTTLVPSESSPVAEARVPDVSAADSPVAEARLPDVSEVAVDSITPESTISAACTGSGLCADVFLDSPDGSCVTNLGRPCEEAFADQALRRWITDGASGSPRAGDTKLLEVIEGQTLVVGYAVGAGLEPLRAEVVANGVHVHVVLRFIDRAVPTTMPDGEEVVLRLPMLHIGRELVTLDAPLGMRRVHISIGVEPAR